MERLLERLDSIQNQILSLYERDSVELEDQILLWSLIRKENVIWHVLRKEGHTKVGGRSVPSLASSEASAKAAIELQLKLESLNESPYAREGWSLQETSQERYLSEPNRTFKKLGQPVTLIFDNDPDNATEVVQWKYVYYQKPDDTWYKATGGIDELGIYYTDHEGVRRYYVDFQTEAQNYSNTGQVTYRIGSALGSVPEPVTVTDSAPQQDADKRRAPPLRRRNSETGEASPAQRRRGRYTRRASPPSGRQRGQETPVRRRQRGTTAGSAGDASEGPDQRPRVLREKTPGSAERRRGHFLVGAKGPVNSLRCLRYKWKRHRSDILYLGTTFTWTEPDGTERCGSGRFLCAFQNERTRERFLATVIPPKNIGLFRAEAESL